MRIMMLTVGLVAVVACGGTSDRDPFGPVGPPVTSNSINGSPELAVDKEAGFTDSTTVDSPATTSSTDTPFGLNSDLTSDVDGAMADLDRLLADLERDLAEMETSFEQGEE